MSDEEKSSVISDTASKKSESVTIKTDVPLKTTDAKKRGKSPVPTTSTHKRSDEPQLPTVVSPHVECKIITQYQRVSSLAELSQELQRPAAAHWSLEEVDFRIEFLEDQWRSFNSTHELLEENATAAFLTHPYVTTGTYSKAYRPYMEARLTLRKLRDNVKTQRARNEATETDSFSSGTSRQRLPEISLPSFSGEYSQWIPFRDLFSAMVRENDSISNVEKMHYLRTSLSGSAAQLVANLPMSGDSFQATWNHLTARYDNKRLLITAQLDKLFGDASPSPKTAAGLNALINSTTEALNALTALGAPVDQWDHVLVHHLTRRLDSTTRESWEVKQGSSMEPPTYEQLKTYITGRARAMESMELGKAAPAQSSRSASASSSRQTHRPSSARSYSLATENPGFPCAMCQSTHFIVVCSRFRALSPQARRDLVIKKRLCFNCLGPHNASECHATKRCKECDGKHHTMIHVPGIHQDSQLASASKGSATSSSSTK